MLPGVIGILLLFLTALLVSFIEAGALLGATPASQDPGDTDSARSGERARIVASLGAIVVAMVVLRAQIGILLSVWVTRSIEKSELSLGFVATLITTTLVLGEVAGKLIALRFPVRAQRTVRPLHSLLARFRPAWFHYGH